MKRLLTVLGILVSLVGLGIAGLFTAARLNTEVTGLTGQGLDACHRSDAAAGLEAVTEIRKALEQKENFLRLYVHKTRLDILEEQLVLAESYLEEEDYGLAASCFHQVAWQVGELYEDELPLWKNIL